MFSLPAKLYDKAGAYLIIPVLLLTVVAVLLTTRLDFESGFRIFLPEDDPYRQLSEELVDTFGQNDLVIVALDVDDLISPTALNRIDELATAAAEIPGAGDVISLTNLQDLYQVDGALELRPVYQPDADPGADELSERVLETPLFRKLFVSQDGQALYTYIVPEDDIVPAEFGDEVITRLDAPNVHFFGDSVAKAFVSRTVVSELVVLGAIAVIIIFLFETLISRSFLVGLTLSVVSIVPSFWTLAFFHVIGGAVQTNTMMVPVIVLVLATSYGIHIYRYHSVGDGNMTRTLQQVGRVVMAAGATTLIGFASLLVTPNRILTHLGILIMFGIVAALITALFLLPPILDLLPDRIWAYSRRNGSRRRRRVPDPTDSFAADSSVDDDDGHPVSGAGPVIRWLAKPPKRPVLRLIIAGGVIIAVAAAIPMVRSGYSVRDTFRNRTEIARSVEYFQERAGAVHDLDIYVGTGQEYGLVDIEAYDRLREYQVRLENDEAVSLSVSYIDFVDFMLGRMEGSLEPIRPRSAAEVGEAMQLLSDSGAGLSFDAVVDGGWQSTRMLLQVSLPPISDPAGVEALESLLQRFRSYLGGSTALRDSTGARIAGFEPPGFASAAILGIPVENLHQITYLTRSQVISLVAFAPIIVIFLMLVFRSIPWAALTLVPTVAGVLVYFGVLGWMGFLHDPIHVFMVAALMGVSNDDVLYFVLVFRRASRDKSYELALRDTVHKTGTAIIQTTLTIAAGIAAFYFSRFILLGRAGLVATIGLAAATATTLIVIPSILRLSPGLLRRARQSGR